MLTGRPTRDSSRVCMLAPLLAEGEGQVGQGIPGHMRHVPVALEDATTVFGGGTGRALADVYLPAVRTTLVAVS